MLFPMPLISPSDQAASEVAAARPWVLLACLSPCVGSGCFYGVGKEAVLPGACPGGFCVPRLLHGQKTTFRLPATLRGRARVASPPLTAPSLQPLPQPAAPGLLTAEDVIPLFPRVVDGGGRWALCSAAPDKRPGDSRWFLLLPSLPPNPTWAELPSPPASKWAFEGSRLDEKQEPKEITWCPELFSAARAPPRSHPDPAPRLKSREPDGRAVAPFCSLMAGRSNSNKA